jgi:cellobiose phosphorylase
LGDVRVSRRFRGAEYRISIRKEVGALGRVSSIMVDGRRVDGTLVPVSDATGSTVSVEAVVERLGPQQR